MGDLMAFIQANVLNDVQQHGVKGQKWGVRRDVNPSTGLVGGKSDAISEHNATTDRLVKALKSASSSSQIESIISKAETDGHYENNFKIENITEDSRRKEATYNFKAYRYTPGKGNTSMEDGVKVEYFSSRVTTRSANVKGRVARVALATAGGYLMAHSEEEKVNAFLEHHGVKGQKWGVRRAINPATGLVARTSSADQIHQDRVAKKLTTHGTKALSNKDIQDYVRRLQLQKELDKATKEAIPEKTHGFIRNYIHNQGARQIDRVANKAVDVAVEKAIEQFGLSLGKKGHNPDVVDSIVETSKRLKPKKK